MTILQEIFKWSKDLPKWQQDAIARFYQKNEISDHDLNDIYALLKSENGIEDDQGRVPNLLDEEEVAVPHTDDKSVQLVAIKNLKNVNALAENQRIPIGETGLSVIYGENGTGKSGYSRVFKKACRARDQREPILPNVNADPQTHGPSKAEFELLVDGEPLEVVWESDVAAPEELSSIAIFDAHCARAYVDNQGDFAYVPYGLDILEGLASVCTNVKQMAVSELNRNKPRIETFASLAASQTKVGKFLSALSAKTKSEELDELCNLSEIEQLRFKSVVDALAETDPKQKAQALKLQSARLTSLLERIEKAKIAIGDEKVAGLKALIDKSALAKKAALLASQKFRDTPDLLPGTGGEIWKELFDAARKFAIDSHPSMIFPNLGADANCPLCQNKLQDEGARRLEKFEEFYQQAAEKADKEAREVAVAAFTELREVGINLLIDGALTKELEEIDVGLAANCLSLQVELDSRKKLILEACKPESDWKIVSSLSVGHEDSLKIEIQKIFGEVKALEASMDEKAKPALLSEKQELEARVKLGDFKIAVLEAIEQYCLVEKLSACANSTGTNGISRKSTELSKTMATQEVADALNAELEELNVHELKVIMQPTSSGGKTRFKLVLEVKGKVAAKDILSEGEQRAIAIASFLAEVNLGKQLGGVVFDDPMSSLDHRRRWHVAKRLAEESKKRQVIVLTHDIYFLCILQQEANSIGVKLLAQCIRKDVSGFGVQTNRLPFDAMPTKKRVKELRLMQQEAAKLHKLGGEAQTTSIVRKTYYHLRIAWERAVEEVLLQSAVTRFGEGVSTKKLSYVEVRDSDYSTIDAGMTKSSKFAHDPALAAQIPTPHPNELLADIDALELWRSDVEARKNDVRERRC
ncbi:MAG: hypothetical protein ACI9SP_004344 [Arenicella sp.]|jgi:hypothetical protein